jgi:hypothetical protein
VTTTRHRAGIIAAWTAAAVLGLAAAAGAATSVASADPSPAPSSSTNAAPKPGEPDRAHKARRHARPFLGRWGLGGRALHGEFVVKDKDGKYVTLLSQRGTVAAVDSDSIKLRSEDGFTRTYTVNSDTKIRRNHDAAKIGDIKVGDNAAVVATKSGNGGTARLVVAHIPATGD